MTESFDLLGDPIPANFKKRGRPPHIPTVENRNKVMMLLAMGWTDGRIAKALSITEPTLRRHYFRELRARDEAKSRLEAKHMFNVWMQACEGNVGAQRLFGQIMEKADLMIPKPPRQGVDDRDGKAKAQKLGKKEQADIDAQKPLGDWADVLRGADDGKLN